MRAVARPALVEVAKMGVLTKAKALSLEDEAFSRVENLLPGLMLAAARKSGAGTVC
jgi:hypothetical protein